MAKLYYLEKDGEAKPVDEKTFNDEVADMEAFIKKNISILGEYFVFAEQAVLSGSQKRMDLLAVDKDGRITIIELKNTPVGMEILPQIIDYWSLAKKNPDGIKNYWETTRNKPEEIKPEFSGFDPKILIVAPSISDEIVEGTEEALNIDVEFIEVSRYQEEKTIFVIVNNKEVIKKTLKPSTKQQEYNWAHYTTALSWETETVEKMKMLADKIMDLAKRKHWEISLKFNKYYIALQHGHNNAFWLERQHSKKVSLALHLKDENEKPDSSMIWTWNKNWNFWYYEFENKTTPDINILEKALEKAYKNIL